MSDRHEPLSEHVAVRIDDARLARQWGNVAMRLSIGWRRPFALPALAGALATIAIVALLVVVVRPWRTEMVTAPAPAVMDEALVLPDGSRVARSPSTQLEVRDATVERVWLALSAGTIDLDVTHIEGRSFVVSAGGHDVVVVGTKFTVSLLDGKVAVAVREGRVRVRGRGVERLLGAGESWSGPAAELAPPEVTPEEDAGPVIELPATSPSGAARPVEGPKELLAKAMAARAEGKSRESAAAFDTLRKRHRSDARAGLAAFELGRIRLDALGDPAGAAEAFADAVALAPNAPFREDAEARRVEALERAGDVARCAKAREAFLARHPQGLHSRQVAARCPRP
jgi:transmembrane sensor